jgi:hemolysin III
MAVIVTFASLFIIRRALRLRDTSRLIGTIIFSLSMIELYTVSAVYHGSTDLVLKKTMRFVDHCSVFCLIAGSYTAYGLSVLRAHGGYFWMTVLWGIAFVGTLGKIFYFDVVDRFTAEIYVLQGWIAVLSFKTVSKVLTKKALFWLVAGGISYTIGAVFYSFKRPFFHAIFHVFIMIGTACHILSYHRYT